MLPSSSKEFVRAINEAGRGRDNGLIVWHGNCTSGRSPTTLSHDFPDVNTTAAERSGATATSKTPIELIDFPFSCNLSFSLFSFSSLRPSPLCLAGSGSAAPSCAVHFCARRARRRYVEKVDCAETFRCSPRAWKCQSRSKCEVTRSLQQHSREYCRFRQDSSLLPNMAKQLGGGGNSIWTRRWHALAPSPLRRR